MLVTAAAAGILAWANLAWQRSRPYQKTPIPESLGNFNDIQAICNSLGYPTYSYSVSGGGSSGRRATTHSYDAHFDLPKKLRGPFMEAFQQMTRGVLDKHADRVSGAGAKYDRVGLHGFDFEYAKGSTQGTVAVRSVGNEQEIVLLIFVHEYDPRP